MPAALRPPRHQAPTLVSEPRSEWVRFTAAAGGAGGAALALDLGLELRAAPGPPAAWKGHVLLEEGQVEAGTSAGGVERIRCGQPFLLRVEAKDAHGNRWAGRRVAGPFWCGYYSEERSSVAPSTQVVPK